MAKIKKARRTKRRQALQDIGWASTQWSRMIHDQRVRARTVLATAEERIAEVTSNAIVEVVTRAPATDKDGNKLHPQQPDALKLNQDAKDGVQDNAGFTTQLLGRGVYAGLYGHPEPVEHGPAWAQLVAKAIGESPDHERLRKTIRHDADMAALATTSVFRAVEPLIPDMIEELWRRGQAPGQAPQQPNSEEPCDGGDSPDGQGGEGDSQGGQQGPGDGQQQPGQGQGQPGQGTGGGGQGGQQPNADTMQDLAEQFAGAMSKALRDAAEDVAEARSALEGVLPGLGAPPLRKDERDEFRMDLAETLLDTEGMQRVLRIAGRITRIADRTRKQRAADVREEIVGVEVGADLARALPSQLLALGDEDLEPLFYQRFHERQLLQYEMSGKEDLGRGPIVALVDCSASMNDLIPGIGLKRMQVGAAVAIACIRSAVIQSRDVALCMFNGGIQAEWKVSAGDTRAATNAILDIARTVGTGGTMFDIAVEWGLRAGVELDRSDLVMVTDGLGGVSHYVQERLADSKARGMRFFGIIAGAGGFHESLQDLADQIEEVSDEDGDWDVRIGKMGV